MGRLLIIQTTRFDWTDDQDPTVRATTNARVTWRRRHARRLIGRASRRGHTVVVRELDTADILRELLRQETDL